MTEERKLRDAPKVPRVSVVMATYNHEPYLRQAVDSVLAQRGSFTLEVVLAEDYSSDGTRAIAEGYAKAGPETVRLVTGPQNVGLVRNCLRALDACSGDFIAFCEGDDWWCDSRKLSRQLAQFADHRVGMVHGNYTVGRLAGSTWVVDASGIHDEVPGSELAGANLFPAYLRRLVPRFSSSVFRRDLVETFLKSPLSRPDFATLDLPLTVFAAAEASVGYDPVIGTAYRLSPRSITRSGLRSMQAYLRNIEMIYDEIANLYGARSDFDRSAAAWLHDNQARVAFRLNDTAGFADAVGKLGRCDGKRLGTTGMRVRRFAMAVPGGARLFNRAINHWAAFRNDVPSSGLR